MQITKQDWEMVKKSCEDTIKRATLDIAMAEVGLNKAMGELTTFKDDKPSNNTKGNGGTS